MAALVANALNHSNSCKISGQLGASAAGDSYVRIIDGFGTAGNDTELTLIHAQCAKSETLLGFRAAPGCLGITQFQVCAAPVVNGQHAFASCSLLDNASAPRLLQERPLQCSWLATLHSSVFEHDVPECAGKTCIK